MLANTNDAFYRVQQHGHRHFADLHVVEASDLPAYDAVLNPTRTAASVPGPAAAGGLREGLIRRAMIATIESASIPAY